MLIKIGETYYRVGATGLEAVDTPETEPTEFIDGGSFLGEADALELVDFRNLVVDAQAKFAAARDAAAKTGSTDDITAMKDAQARFLVLNGEYADRAEAISNALGDIEIPEAPKGATPPNETKKPEGGTEDGGTGGENSDGGSDGSEGETGGETIDLGALSSEQLLDVVAATAAKAVESVMTKPGNVSASGRPDPRFASKGLSLSDLASGGTRGGTSAPAGKNARMLAAAGQQVIDTGSEMSDAQFLEAFQDFERSRSGPGQIQASPKQTIARFEIFSTEDSAMMDKDAPEAFRAVRASAGAGHHPRIHADGSSCDSCVTTADVRRSIPDTLLDVDPLGNLFQTYPAPHCELKYYKALSLASIDAGITIWDDAAKTAFCDARDAWFASIKAGTPDIAEYAAMKAAEKECAIPSCAPEDTVKPIGVSACLRYPLEMEHCNPELIPVYRRALNTRFTQRLNQRRLAQVENYSIPVSLDVVGAGSPFVNADGDQLGAGPVVMDVVQSLLSRGVMAERVDGGQYVLAMPFSFASFLVSDDSKTVDKMRREISDYLGLPVVIFYEYGDDESIVPADILAGQGGPYVFNSLPTTKKEGNAGTDYIGNLQWPTSWKLNLFDPSDFFQITRPEVNVGAQVTPDDAVQNMVFGMFQETFFGIGKDGNHPAWTISFENLLNNGARAAGIRPVSTVVGP